MMSLHSNLRTAQGAAGRGLAWALSLALTSGGLALTGCGRKQPIRAGVLPEVVVAHVQRQDVPITREWVATMDGLINAQVTAQVAGYLVNQKYKSGDFVRKGAPLFEIDSRAFAAAASEAQAGVEQSEGLLKQALTSLQNAEAQRGKTKLDVARARPLAEEQAISRQELDNAVQADLSSAAQVAGSEAAIGAAKSAIDVAKAKLQTAELNLNFTRVTSPVDGIAGINSAQIGNLVGPQSGPLTTVSTVDPILVTFTVSEAEYFDIVKRIAATGKTEQAVLGKLEFTLQLADGSKYPQVGRIHAVDRQVDVKTGSILVQTEFPNPGNVLRPGGFGRISTAAGFERGALLVPQRSILEVQGTHFVGVVGPNNIVKLRFVDLGATMGAMRVVSKGLQAADAVIIEGIQKVRDGIQVNPKTSELNQGSPSR